MTAMQGANASERLTAKGLSTYRLMLPKGMDANEYALQVTPARESFGALIRGAKWLGKGAAPTATAEETQAIIHEHEILMAFGDRHWRIRGLARNTSYEALRINLLVSREASGAAVFHVDTLDLYAARQRTSCRRRRSKAIWPESY